MANLIFVLSIIVLGVIIVWLLNRHDYASNAYDRGKGHRGPVLSEDADWRYNNVYKQKYKARAYDKGFNALQKAHDKQSAIDGRNRDRARKKGIIK
jgi:hypothetical protein